MQKNKQTIENNLNLSVALTGYFDKKRLAVEAEQKTAALYLELSGKMVELQAVLLERKKNNNNFLPELVHPWTNGYNYFVSGGCFYRFRYNEEEWKIESIEQISMFYFDGKEV